MDLQPESRTTKRVAMTADRGLVSAPSGGTRLRRATLHIFAERGPHPRAPGEDPFVDLIYACNRCGALRRWGSEPREETDARLCEVCRYDFVAKKPGPPPVVQRLGRQTGPVPTPTSSPKPPSTPPPPPPPTQARSRGRDTGRAPAKGWELLLAVDPSLDVEPDPATPCPKDVADRIIPMDKPEILVGRHDDQRDIHPELPLHDPGASRRHAKFVLDADGCIALQDLASTNGTVLNGRELTPGTRRRLKVGDEVTIDAGHGCGPGRQ
jgi:hypothetical protein